MRKTNEQSLGEVIRDLLDEYKLHDGLSETRLIAAWESVVGRMIARHTERLFIRDKVLFVKTNSPPMKQELLYSKSKIIEALNKKAGSEVINNINFL